MFELGGCRPAARSLLRWIFVALLVGVVLPARAKATRSATLSGFVYDKSSGEALISASVYLDSTTVGAVTNEGGYYVIPNIVPGDYTLVAGYVGFESARLAISLAPGESREAVMRLSPVPIVRDTFVVTAEAVPTAERLFEQPVSTVELSAEQIAQVPQVAEPDLLRTLQSLPGIVPVSDFSSELYIRGGTPDQNLYLIDGADVYNPEHAFGLFSTFNTEAIKQVELSKGGFGAEYGGRLSSIIDITNLDGNREQMAGAASISLLSAKATVQAPISRRASLSGSIRRTYLDQTVGRVDEDIPDYYFIDGSLKAHIDLGEHNKLTLSGFRSYDDLDFTFNTSSPDPSQVRYDWGNGTASARWTTVLTPRLFANVWLTTSRYESNLDFGDALAFSEQNDVRDVTFKAQGVYHVSRHFRLGLGLEHKWLELSYRQDFPNGRVDIVGQPRLTTLYANETWIPTERWNVQGGLRFDYFDSDTTFPRLAPRASVKYRLTPTVNLKASGGVYYQFLHRAPRPFVADVWSFANRYQGPSTGYHAILGVQKELGDHFQLEVEPYYKRYLDIYTFVDNNAVNATPGYYENNEYVYSSTENLFYRGDAYTYGVDIMLRREVGALTGWLGYGFAYTRGAYDGINGNRSFPPRHDRHSTFNLTGNMDIRNFLRGLRGEPPVQRRSTWSLGFTFVYMTGQPITQPTSGYFIRTFPDRDTNVPFEYYPSDINNIRLPHYARLDLSLTWEKRYRGWSLCPYLQIFNVGNRSNVWFLTYDLEGATQTVEPEYMFPILPTLGVRVEF